MFLQNTGECIPDHTAVHPKRQQSSGIYKFVLLLSLFTFNYLIMFVEHVLMGWLDFSYSPLKIKFNCSKYYLKFWHFPEKIKLIQILKCYSNMHLIFYGLQNYEHIQQTRTAVNGKNIPLLQDYMHSKLSMAPRDFWCREAFQAVRQSHKKQSQQQLAMSLNQLSMLATVIHATAEVRIAM